MKTYDPAEARRSRHSPAGLKIKRGDTMDRREFLLRSAAVSGAVAWPAIAWPSMSLSQSAPSSAAELTLHPQPDAVKIPLTYSGLSYELAQLTDPAFFSAANRDLVAYFRLLSPNGVLRVGGNTSEFCWFRANASTPEPKLHVPSGNSDTNWMPHRLFAIEPAAIDALAGFLEATGWRLIYGLNLGNSSPQRAAEEAAYVAAKVGQRLEFFQIGNEPDLYHNASNGTRPPNWGFADYLEDWTAFAEAIALRVPSARFGGPDVGASSDWVIRFGEQVPARIGARLIALTGHYYAEGPPNDPRMTTTRLLAGNPNIPAEMQRIEAGSRAHGRVFRMTEGNSCYRGGKPGMSDAFAAALWGGDYMLLLASLGCAGVNLHGGSSAFLTASLGDHTPGMDVAKTPQKVKGGFYTPISTEPGSPDRAAPIFYGMLLANQLAGGMPLQVEGLPTGVNATAYSVQSDHGFKVAIFNKDEHQALDLILRVPLNLRPPGKVRRATAWRLAAPALDSTQGVTLAGASIGEHAAWRPMQAESLPFQSETAQIRVPAASAALVFLT